MVRDGRFPLLLLLSPFALLCPLWALPKRVTKAQWFEIQHIQPNPQQCDGAMGGVNNYTRRCKPVNTFLHDSFRDVSDSCNSPNITCKNGQQNCHQSPRPVKLTHCQLTGGKYPHCHYKSAMQFKFFIVACEPPQKTDPPYPLVPVHLDEII